MYENKVNDPSAGYGVGTRGVMAQNGPPPKPLAELDSLVNECRNVATIALDAANQLSFLLKGEPAIDSKENMARPDSMNGFVELRNAVADIRERLGAIRNVSEQLKASIGEYKII